MKITIDNPCYENWDAMTPNEKGAFCLSCRENVIDFTSKTLEEIKSFFASLSGKATICGRFREQQLKKLSFENFYNEFNGLRLFQKIAIVVFFTFSSVLLNGQTNPKQRTMNIKGEVYLAPKDTSKTIKKDKAPAIKPPKDFRHKEVKEEPVIMGKPSVRKEN